MNYPYLQLPLTDNIIEFLEDIEEQFIAGRMTIKEYHICLGKALGYTETRYSLNLMSKYEAYYLINLIEAKLDQ